MPAKALVALGAAFGLLILSAPCWGTGMSEPENGGNRPAGAAPTSTEVSNSGSASSLPVLTLDQALTRLLQQSPRLSSLVHEITARKYDAAQAGLRPNPEFSVEMENFAGSGQFSGTDSAETTVRLSQVLELGGKRARRHDVGRLDREAAEREYQIARADLLAETAERFFAALAAQQRVALAEEQAALTGEVLQTVEERIAAGKTPEIERIRFQALVSEARLRLQQARQELTTSRHALATLWGSAQADFSRVQGPFDEIHPIPEWPKVASLLDDSPQIDLQTTVIRRTDRVLSLERARRIPDLTVSLGVKNDQGSGDNALVAEISLPLPVFDRNRDAVAAARARRAKARNGALDARLQLQTELLEAWRKLRAAHSEIEMLREEIVPTAQQGFDGVVYGYQAGKFGFLDVLEAEKSLFEARSRYIEAAATYHRTASHAERLLGQKIFADEGSRQLDETERGKS